MDVPAGFLWENGVMYDLNKLIPPRAERENARLDTSPPEEAYSLVCPLLENDRDAAERRRGIQSAREGACCRLPSKRCTALAFGALTWTPFWP
jgi:hypothetical protein